MTSEVMFSIITPCFNSQKTIEHTIKSVLNQTYKNYEYIIIDGGSTDETLDIIDKYRGKFGEKLRVVSEHDSGIYDAMNKGIKLAKGILIGIVNSDDFYELDCLKLVKEKWDRKNVYQIIYGMMRVVDREEQELSIIFQNHKNMKAKIINHPATFVSKKIYDDFGLYNIKFRSASDYDFMLNMIEKSEIVFIPVYAILTNFTKGGISGSYIGIQEDNIIRYKHGLIGKKKYYLTKVKNYLKNILRI